MTRCFDSIAARPLAIHWSTAAMITVLNLHEKQRFSQSCRSIHSMSRIFSPVNHRLKNQSIYPCGFDWPISAYRWKVRLFLHSIDRSIDLMDKRDTKNEPNGRAHCIASISSFISFSLLVDNEVLFYSIFSVCRSFPLTHSI